MATGTFELKKAAGDKFHFVLKAKNRQTILSSEIYETKKAALNGIASVRKNAEKEARYEQQTSTSGKPYFVLKAANGEVIGSSQMYASTRSVKRGIASVQANAASAELSDAT